MSRTVYLSASTQDTNIGVAGYGTEETNMQYLADLVKTYIEKGKGDIIVYRNNGNMTLQSTINDSNSKHPEIHVALHSNAGGGKGTEIYYSNYPIYSANGFILASKVYNAVAPLTISPDRGIHADTVLYDRGLAETRDTMAIACLIEIMFHDNATDVKDYLSKQHDIAKAIAMSIYDYFGMSYYIEPTPQPTPTPTGEREKVIKYLNEVSNWSTKYVNEFDQLQNKGVNVYGVICKIINFVKEGN
jgi:N-acetylmuramoyl-L-alanine amidase